MLNWNFNPTLVPSKLLGAFGILALEYFLRFVGALLKDSLHFLTESTIIPTNVIRISGVVNLNLHMILVPI